MKLTLLSIAFFISAQSFSQNWQTVASDRIALFEFSNSSPFYVYSKQLRVIKIDSIAVQGSDSVFFNYRTMRDLYNGCYQNDTGWIGSSIVIRSNGDNVFFNQQMDSVIIKTVAGVGNTWRLFELGSGSYLEAEITSSQVETVLSTTDSVKTILLNAKNNLGQPIVHLMNNKIIKISKQHGILTPFRFYDFPGDPTHFEISGKQLLTKRDIYNFDVGDLFQWDGYDVFVFTGFPNYAQTYDETRVLSKNTSTNGDSITYIFDNIHYRKTYIWPGPVTSVTYTHDTATVVMQFPPVGTIDLFPNQLFSLSGSTFGFAEQLSDSTYYHDRRIRQQSEYFVYNMSQSCITAIIGGCIYWDYYYADGLGNVAIYDGSQFPACIDYHMVYYQKGSETWGTPLDWATILGVNEQSQSDFKVFPNPFTNEVNIDWTAFQTQPVKIEISDATGKIVKRLTTDNPSKLKIPTGDLSSGFYFLSLQSKANSLHYKLVKN